MQNGNGIAANEGTTLRELSLDEMQMVGGGFSWGGLLRGVEHFGSDVEHGMVAGAITGGVGGALADGVGAAPGALVGSLVGAVGGALTFLKI